MAVWSWNCCATEFYIVRFSLCSSAIYSTWYSRGLTAVMKHYILSPKNQFSKIWSFSYLWTSRGSLQSSRPKSPTLYRRPPDVRHSMEVSDKWPQDSASQENNLGEGNWRLEFGISGIQPFVWRGKTASGPPFHSNVCTSSPHVNGEGKDFLWQELEESSVAEATHIFRTLLFTANISVFENWSIFS